MWTVMFVTEGNIVNKGERHRNQKLLLNFTKSKGASGKKAASLHDQICRSVLGEQLSLTLEAIAVTYQFYPSITKFDPKPNQNKARTNFQQEYPVLITNKNMNESHRSKRYWL